MAQIKRADHGGSDRTGSEPQIIKADPTVPNERAGEDARKHD